MSKYEKYKPSGIDWIGEVPEHWAVKRLKNIVLNDIGGLWGDEPTDDENDIIVLRVADFDRTNSRIIDNQNFTYRNIKASQLDGRLIKQGDILLEKSGGGEQQPVGKAVLFDKDFRAVTSNFINKIEIMPSVNNHFALYLFDALYYKNINVRNIKQTTGIQNLDNVGFFSEKISLPPSSEQLTIANYLDDQTQKIDRLIANKKAQAEKLKELRQIEINNAVTKGLDQDFEDGRMNRMNSDKPSGKSSNPENPEADNYKDSGIEWLGKIPKHWEVKRLKNVADINATKQELKYDEVKDLEVVFLAMESVSENGLIDNSEKRPVSKLWEGFTYFQKNDVIIAKITPCFENGKGAWLNNLESDFGFGSTEFHTVRGHKGRLDNHFFYHVTKSDVFMKIGEAFMTGSAGQKRVSTNFVLTFKLAIPPIEEQIQIANYLQQRTTAIDQLIKNIDAQIEKLQELRKIKIYEAVTGKIKVNGYEKRN